MIFFLPLVGAAIGAATSAIQAASQRRQQRNLMSRIRAGIAEGEAVSMGTAKNLGESQEYQAVLNSIRGIYGLNPVSAQDTFFINNQKVAYGASAMPASQLGTVGFGTVLEQFRKNFKQAQVSRGIYDSQIAASAEAGGMMEWQFQKQLEAAPTLMGLIERPTKFYQEVADANMNRSIMRITGGAADFRAQPGLGQTPNVFGSTMEGLMGGMFAGASLGMNLGTLNLMEQQANKPQTGYGDLFGINQLGSALGDVYGKAKGVMSAYLRGGR